MGPQPEHYKQLFTGWGSGITTGHNSPIATVDFTNYPGTSQIGLAVTGNTFVASHSQPSYYNYDGELGAGGAGFIRTSCGKITR